MTIPRKRGLRSFRSSLLVAAAVALLVAGASAQQPTKQTVDGVTNFARVETTVACGGATSPEAVPEVKKMGFASIINLRLSTERDAKIPEEEAAAEAAGMKFVHIPFSASSPDPAAVDEFINAITTPGTEPAYIHCSGGNRAAAMWMAKRLVVDHWDVERATTEAEGLGLTSSVLKDFIVTYSLTHKK